MIFKKNLSKAEVREEIQKFLDRRGGPWDWDDFTSVRLANPELDKIRQIAADVADDFPPGIGDRYTNDQGYEVLRNLVARLSEE